MRDDLPLILDRIRGLLDARSGDAGKHLLPQIEHTLTDGYAHALALDAERLRLEKRIAVLVRELGDADEGVELRDLAGRLSGTEEAHGTLRGLLGDLSRLADELRATEALR